MFLDCRGRPGTEGPSDTTSTPPVLCTAEEDPPAPTFTPAVGTGWAEEGRDSASSSCCSFTLHTHTLMPAGAGTCLWTLGWGQVRPGRKTQPARERLRGLLMESDLDLSKTSDSQRCWSQVTSTSLKIPPNHLFLWVISIDICPVRNYS